MLCTRSLRDCAQSSSKGAAIVALGQRQFHLDQFVIVECALEFGENAFGQAVLGYDQYRFQVVTDRFELFLLLLSERHNQTPGKKSSILPQF